MLGSDGQKSNTFFYQGDDVEIEIGAEFEFVNTFGHLKMELKLKVMARCKYDRNTDLVGIIVQKAKTMKAECITYKPGIFLTIETDYTSYWLHFVRIEHLLVLKNLKFAVVQCYKTMVFNKFINMYEKSEDVGKKKIIILRDLENKITLPSAIVKGYKYKMTHHCTFCNGPY